MLAGRKPIDPDRVQAEIEVVAALGAEAHAELRAVIDGLAPPDLEAAGLADSLRRYTVLAGRAHGIPVTFSAAKLPPLDRRAEAALYRVAQEALHNALRHSGAGRVGRTAGARPTPRVAGGVRRRARVRARGAVRRGGAGLDAGARVGGGRHADHTVRPGRHPVRMTVPAAVGSR